jgi:Ca2+-binding EF-hand superfamily protein|tara:strand:- start:11650 stop:12150 length:501 start_codon:yes stop_codon:yes gene_type:complete
MLNNSNSNSDNNDIDMNEQKNNQNNVDQINDEEKNKIKEAFALFDQNDDGILTKDELITLLRSLGKYVTENDVDNLIRNVNTIDISNFMIILNKIAPKDTQQNLQEAFEILDSENNGYINVPEFRHILTNLGEKLTNDEIDNIIIQLDINDEGKIYKEIFLTTLLQ